MSKYFLSRLVCLCLVLAAIVPLVGCDENTKKNIAILGGAISSGIAQSRQSQSSYQRPDWKAEEYFDDPKVIRLCNAIRKRDLTLIDKLIAEGADVNAKGKGNMTPLLWAFVQGRPWNKPPSLANRNKPGFTEKWASEEFDAAHLAIFTKLLEHGADPNVQFTATFFEKNNHINDGLPHMPITRIVQFLPLSYFETVMKHKGDPHLYYSLREPITYVDSVVSHANPFTSKDDSLTRLQLLINAGVDIDQVDDEGMTHLMYNVSSGNYDKAIMLVEAGADWLMASPKEPGFLAPIVGSLVRQEVQTASYLKLVKILEEKGADFDLERKIRRPGQIDIGRMNIDEAESTRREIERLLLQRRELYERIQQERMQ